jgi:nucleolar protein 6
MAEALTKKQQKALAFKTKQKSKRRGDGEIEQPDVPEQDLLDDDDELPEKVVEKKDKKEVVKEVEEAGAEESEKKKGKRKKTAWDDEEDEEEEQAAKKSKKDIKQRFILFVGELYILHYVAELTSRQPWLQDYQRSYRGCIQTSAW